MLLFVMPAIHLMFAPFTKVEESFNMQAAHDILVYGTPVSDNIYGRMSATYDHFTFPGAVPRTFVGAVLLAGIGQPVTWFLGFDRAQLIIRGILGLFNGLCLLVLKLNLDKAFSKNVARWWIVLMATQFHVQFYLTRTLPNMFAFGLSELHSHLLKPQS